MKKKSYTKIIYTVIFLALLFVIITSAARLTGRSNLPYTGHRLIYYNDSGIYEYRSTTSETKRITSLESDAFYGDTEKNIADDVQVSSDGRYAFFMKNYEKGTDNNGWDVYIADLYRTDLALEESARSDELVATSVTAYDLSGDTLVYLTSKNILYAVTDAWSQISDDADEDVFDMNRYKLGICVDEFYLGTSERIFFVDGYGNGYVVYPESISEESAASKIATDIAEVQHTSESLDKIYYVNAYEDLFYIGDLGTARMLDTNISSPLYMEETGNVYFLRALDETSGVDGLDANYYTGDELGDLIDPLIEEVAQGTGTSERLLSVIGNPISQLKYFDGESVHVLRDDVFALPEYVDSTLSRDAILAAARTYTGSVAAAHIYIIEGSNVIDTNLSLQNYLKIDMELYLDPAEKILYFVQSGSASGESSGASDGGASGGDAGGQTVPSTSDGQNADEDADQNTGQGTTSTNTQDDLEDAVGQAGTNTRIDDNTDASDVEDMNQNGATQEDGNLGETSVAVGTQTDDGSAGVLADTLDESDSWMELIGQLQTAMEDLYTNGTLYKASYDENGMHESEKVYDIPVGVILTTAHGNIYSTAYDTDGQLDLYINGEYISGKVAQVYSNTDISSDVAVIYRDVFEDTTDRANTYSYGKVQIYSPSMADSISLYGISEIYEYTDGYYAFVKGYDADMGSGQLLYWDSSLAEPILVCDDVTGVGE